MRKIAIVGPESSGKSFLVKSLANYFKASYTDEFARTFLKDKKEYIQQDLLAIAKGQINLEKEQDCDLLFCDTNVLSIVVWSEIKYGLVDAELNMLFENNNDYNMTLLLHPDIDYEKDPLRESPKIEDRFEIFNCFKKHLKGYSHFEIRGLGEERVKNAIERTKSYLNL